MGAEQTYAYSPDYAVPPGDTLLEVMESLGITQAELAERTGRPTKTINEIVKGKAAITPETALQRGYILFATRLVWKYLSAAAIGTEHMFPDHYATTKDAELLNALALAKSSFDQAIKGDARSAGA
jgi:addiction module HigA family antidote